MTSPNPVLRVLVGDCRISLRSLAAESVQCCVTSPPYWGLRDYGHGEQLGQEATPQQYVENMVAVFAEVWRVLKADGTLWLNLGDTYAGYHGNKNSAVPTSATNGWTNGTNENLRTSSANRNGLKPKDLIGIPWRVALALQAAGWWLRSDIIWAKPNPMPESVTDRPTKAHEYIFLLTKAESYYYDAAAIAEPVSESSVARLSQPGLYAQEGSTRANGGAKTNGNMKAVGGKETRNKRSVWTVPTQGYKGAHFATFPTALITPCVLAGSRLGDVILDPFGGSGTTCEVALARGRQAVVCELNPEYLPLIAQRTATLGLGL